MEVLLRRTSSRVTRHTRPRGWMLSTLGLLACVAVVSTGRAGAASVLPEDGGMRGEPGAPVRPGLVRFQALPRAHAAATPGLGVMMEGPRGDSPVGRAAVSAMKRMTQAVHAAQLPGVTVDSSGLNAPDIPVTGAGFEGITQNGYIPGEPTVAAGPLNVFTTGNVTVTVTDKDGSNRTEVNGRTFFGVLAGEGAVFDPLCHYDALRGRFLALALTKGTNPNYSAVYIAVSKTSDARGEWWQYRFDLTLDGTRPTTNWGDFPGLGVSDDKIAVSTQQYTLSADTYNYQKLRVMDRAAMYDGLPTGFVDFVMFSPPPTGDKASIFATKPGRNLSPDSTIHVFTVRYKGGPNVAYRRITGPPDAPVLSAGNLVASSVYSLPPDAAQPGTTNLVQTNDCRTPEFHVRDGVLTIAWHFGINFGSGDVTAIRLYRMRTSDRHVLTDETYGADGVFYYYPAAVPDAAGGVYLGFGRSSATEYPSSWATGRRPSETALEPSVLLKPGVIYTAQSRWGDYTGIGMDESASGPGGTSAWYAGQYVKATNNFGAWISPLEFTYGRIGGTAFADCDSNAATSLDRSPLAGATVTLFRGATPVDTASVDTAGNFLFGYLETGAYDAVLTVPPGAAELAVTVGTGADTQAVVSNTRLHFSVTHVQFSDGNEFLVAPAHPWPSTSAATPAHKEVGDTAFDIAVAGSGFTGCSEVRLDGSPRVTVQSGPGSLSARITAADLVVPGAHHVTVWSPAPGGGVSNPQVFYVGIAPDTLPPTVQVLAPNGGEHWPAGSIQSVLWTDGDDRGVDSVRVEYSLHGAGGPWAIAAQNVPNTGSYAWTLPMALTDSAVVRIRAFDTFLNEGLDAGDSLFEFSYPLVGVQPAKPLAFALRRPAPNPARGGVTLRFSLAAAGPAAIEILDVAGRRVWSRRWERLDAGEHFARWEGNGSAGQSAGAGLYFVRLAAAAGTRHEKLVLVR
ncbi:MAG: T9SS type A sorting domain-containing protein [Candidatus Eisenbacteria bacterium]|nr:T9SS type A sorting domain-containing protein [Candidatus Eisenbacteria bacterium]